MYVKENKEEKWKKIKNEGHKKDSKPINCFYIIL